MVEDSTTYKKIKSNPTKKYKTQLKKLTKKTRKQGILDKREYRYSIPDTPRLPVIYQVPKVHKNQTDPPGRPLYCLKWGSVLTTIYNRCQGSEY